MRSNPSIICLILVMNVALIIQNLEGQSGQPRLEVGFLGFSQIDLNERVGGIAYVQGSFEGIYAHLWLHEDVYIQAMGQRYRACFSRLDITYGRNYLDGQLYVIGLGIEKPLWKMVYGKFGADLFYQREEHRGYYTSDVGGVEPVHTQQEIDIFGWQGMMGLSVRLGKYFRMGLEYRVPIGQYNWTSNYMAQNTSFQLFAESGGSWVMKAGVRM